MATTFTTTTGLGDAVRRCRAEQAAWARLPVSARLRPIKALRRLLATECDALCEAVGRDLGKTPEETLAGDVLPLADACRWLQSAAARVLRPRRVSTGQRPLWLWGQTDTVLRRPHGVVGLIGTWNYPIFLSGVALVQALTAGNGVVWKPSEVAPASALALFELVRRAGFPAGLVHLMDATREGGRELAEADIDHVAFTGSSTVGRALATTLAPRLVSSTLELSGCDALFVLDDADVRLAARAAWFGANLNRGQTCLAVRRAFVHRSLYPAFVEVLRPLAEAAPPVRLALRSQAEQADRLVNEALAQGGRLLATPATHAGDDGERLCPPRVVIDARPEMALCREASFAPLLAVLPFDTVDEALRMDAECPFGLGASVFTRHHGRGEALAARLRTGMVGINDVVVPTAHPATPFGGRRASGWGVTQGAEGLLEMTVPQVVSVRTDAYRPHYDMAPGIQVNRGDMIRAFLDIGHGTTLGRRARGFIGLIRALLESK
ncbi:MAG TPA: aldehyde dehydrogenase family protein [Gemmataceae bacterium]|nr:aldehyde dehydrogenase family protein [Gemmataceae bacterium]